MLTINTSVLFFSNMMRAIFSCTISHEQAKKSVRNLAINNLPLILVFIGAFFYSVAGRTEALKNDNLNDFVTSYALNNITHNDDERVEVKMVKLDTNMKLPFCASEIIAALSKKNIPDQSNAVILNCKTKPEWTIYAPISIQVYTHVLSAKRTIMPGETISADDIVFETHDKNRLYDGFFKDKNDVVGLLTSRVISAGAALNRKNLKQEAMIKRNQTITLAVRNKAIEVTMLGIAKSDGALHDTVKVLNPSSKKVLEAVVTGQNRAEIIY